MIYLTIFLIGFIWITRDIIRVPACFMDSWFKKFKGNKFIDPDVSWINKGDPFTFLYFIIVPFSDFFHLLGTIILLLFFLSIYYSQVDSLNIDVFIGLAFLVYGGGVWLGYNLWRKILN